jgi:Fe-S-cluster containining protein
MTMGENPFPTGLIASVQLPVFGRAVQMEFHMPAGVVRPEKMLPVFRSLTDALVQTAGDAVREQDLAVSCQKGCAACCRKLVPISKLEARRIGELVQELSEPMRSEVRARFDAARRRLEEAGLLDELTRLDQLTDDECWVVGLSYFRHWIACPFLEREACVIYSERPLACREYAVTSPAENCFPESAAETVDRLNLPCSVSSALASVGDTPTERRTEWVPLILATAWADSHADEAAPREALELLREVLDNLAGDSAG